LTGTTKSHGYNNTQKKQNEKAKKEMSMEEGCEQRRIGPKKGQFSHLLSKLHSQGEKL